MEVTSIAGRCARRSVTKSSSSPRQIPNLTSSRRTSPVHQCQFKNSTSRRTFTTSVRKLEDRSFPSTGPNAQNRESREGSGPVTGQGQRQDARPLRSATSYLRSERSNDPDRLDLSSIPGIGNNPDYVAPKHLNREKSAAAAAQLRKMFEEQKKNATPATTNTNPFGRQRGTTSDNIRTSFINANNSDDGIGGGLDVYRQSRLSREDVTSILSNLSQDVTKTTDSFQIPLRLRPTLGRTVDITGGYDLTRAFRALEIKCATNGVKRDLFKQKFHVRRGQRRKMDRVARWRVLFRQGFSHDVARIQRMKAQGW